MHKVMESYQSFCITKLYEGEEEEEDIYGKAAAFSGHLFVIK